MDDIINKINKLIRLSDSSNENEAALASIKAIKLIKKHGVVLRLPTSNKIGNFEFNSFDLYSFFDAIIGAKMDVKKR